MASKAKGGVPMVEPHAVKSRRISAAGLVMGQSQTGDFLGKSKTTIKPTNQLQLTAEELSEEFTRVLSAINPQAHKNQVLFCNNAMEFVDKPAEEGTLILFSQKGYLLDIDSFEAQHQLRWSPKKTEHTNVRHTEEVLEEQKLEEEEGAEEGTMAEDEEAEEETQAEEPEPESQHEAEEVDEEEKVEDAAEDDDGDDGFESAEDAPAQLKKKLANAFNFCERASQTSTLTNKDACIETQPPPRASLSANVCLGSIYDTYLANHQQLEAAKQAASGKPPPRAPAPPPVRVSFERKGEQELLSVATQTRKVERIINQNTYDEIAQDFKYYEDPSDEFKEKEGTVLPLWRFSFEPAKKLAVTDICWSQTYSDLFAATFGSFNFLGQSYGQLCLYTMKNPTYPEYHMATSSGIMCVDIHKSFPFLVCIGMYNGTVNVLSLRTTGRSPVVLSKTVKGRHSDSVSKVHWGPDNLDGNHNFYSVSLDGRVMNWQLVQSELRCTEVTTLGMPDVKNEGPDGTIIPVRGCGTTFAFHRKKDSVFLVGTEEGNIYDCSISFSSGYLQSFTAHMQTIYTIDWNHFNTDIYATASADWTVKIWEHGIQKPLFVFDLGSPVGDVCWSPYSSTVFAASTVDGRVHVFDLFVDKYRPICSQAVIDHKKTRMTKVSFCLEHPVIVVGDERGNVTSLKLSPNLRKKTKEQKKADAKRSFEIEMEKIEKLLSIVREALADQ